MQPISSPIYIDQGTDEWHEARLGRATASRFSDIMAGSKYAAYKNYLAELVIERLTETRSDFYTSPAMEWGTQTEPLARLHYQLKSGELVEECGIFLHNELEAGASPDGLIGYAGVLEIKCPNTATHLETLRKQAVPKKYYWQVMGQLWLTGRDWADFVSYDPRLPENAAYFCTRLRRDDEAIAKLAEEVQTFLAAVDTELAFIKSYKG